jgi:hypothetical protein
MSEEWKSANKDYWVKWKIKNPDYYKNYRAKNRQKHLEYNRKYRAENYDKYLIYQARHQAKIKRIKAELKAKQKAEWKLSNTIINLSGTITYDGINKPEDITNNLNSIYDSEQNKFVIPVKKI